MTHVTTDWLLRHTIGFDPLTSFTANHKSFPPHNIEKLDEDNYRLTLAVAGFRRSEISLSTLKGFLTIRGEHSADRPKVTYLYQGIAERDFMREFKLGENVEVVGATLEDGLLVVALRRDTPEAERPRTIAID